MHRRNEIKRLWTLGFTRRQIARASNGKVHRNTVNKYVKEFEEEKLQTLQENISSTSQESNWTNDVDWENIRSEHLRGVPLNILHQELFEANKVPVQYAGFWKQAQKKIDLSEATMVRIFKPAERMEIDYTDGIEILDPATGEIKKTQLFVGVLCHSRYAFAEFTWTQSSSDFLQSHVNMFNYFGGTTQVLSPDNLKSAVTKTHRYDPVINQGYAKLAAHYEVAVVPARVKTPKDKAIVERSIQIFQKWFFMVVRHKTFTSLLELNKCLREHLEKFNNKKHRIFRMTRKEMFEQERASLKALPQDQYKVATYSRATLSRDCHLVFEYNFYSAPYWLRGKELDIWATSTTVEVYHEGERVALHTRHRVKSLFVTDTSHYPSQQQAYAEEDVQKLIVRAACVGPETEKLVRALFESPYPFQFFRRSQGIVGLANKYNKELLELASKEANRFNNRSMKYLERVIKARVGLYNKQENEIKNRSENQFLRGINNIH
ncbi:MAG TPA: IS21 family transposase [Bdellovibrio sp.]|nr:IS21 family transposase [Bdellovibrio sp.]